MPVFIETKFNWIYPKKLLYFENFESIITRYRDPIKFYSNFENQGFWPLEFSQKSQQGKFSAKNYAKDFLIDEIESKKANLINYSTCGVNFNIWSKKHPDKFFMSENFLRREK
jgi:hypothetical protein